MGRVGVSRFIFHQGEIVSEERDEVAAVSRYLRGHGVEYLEQDKEQFPVLKDEQRSTVFILDRDREIQNHYEYDAFGKVKASTDRIENRILYTGQQYDGVTGQYYLRARYYNPVIGRFIQEDPYRGDGLNLYAYCRNNPVKYFDPSGYSGDLNCPGVGFEGQGDNNTVPTDTYVFGNATKPGDARPGKDFGVGSGSDVVSTQSPPLPKGKSVCADPYDTPLTGTIYKVPEGTKLPEGLSIVYDGKDKVPGGHAIGHSTIYPIRDMTVDEFNGLYQSMPWEKGEKKR